MDTGLYLRPNFWTFSSLKSFGNSWGNTYTKFVILDIKLRLVTSRTCTKHLKFPKYYDYGCSWQSTLGKNIHTTVSNTNVYKSEAYVNWWSFRYNFEMVIRLTCKSHKRETVEKVRDILILPEVQNTSLLFSIAIWKVQIKVYKEMKRWPQLFTYPNAELIYWKLHRDIA